VKLVVRKRAEALFTTSFTRLSRELDSSLSQLLDHGLRRILRQGSRSYRHWSHEQSPPERSWYDHFRTRTSWM